MNPRLSRWPMGVATALDRLANAILAGDDRMTLSTRCYEARCKAAAEGRAAPLWARWLGDALERLSPGHLLRAAEFDRAVATVIVIQAIAPPPTPRS